MAGQPTLSISIVNHGNRDETLALLESLASLQERPEVEIIVLDNASEDGSVKAIAAAFPGVSLIAQTHRAGFGANHNTVMEQTASEYVLLINDDARVDPRSVDLLLEYLQRNPTVAAVGPRIVGPSGTRLQTAWTHLGPARAALFAATAGQVGWVLSGTENSRPVGRLSGCALMLRRSALPGPHVFDEGFFMYAEDNDLCVRLRAEGHEVHFVPAATVTHLGRQSSAAVPARRRVEQSRSTHHYLEKHYGWVGAAFTRFALALGHLEKAVAAAVLPKLLRRSVSEEQADVFVRAARDALRVPPGPGLRELAEEYNQRTPDAG